MKVGVVGIGIVGAAVCSGLEQLGHQIKMHDIKYKTSIKNVLHW